MSTNHSKAFIEQALVKVYTRGNKTIQLIAEELSVNYHTLKYWMKKQPQNKPERSATEKRPVDWSAPERLQALQETHDLTEEALNGWCRERGLFAHHLNSWKAAFCGEGKIAVSTTPPELRSLKAENEQLKRSVLRKDKALAEAAALLILQKKFQALRDNEGE